MRKLVSLIMVLVMSLGLSCAWAEAAQDNFLISDWKLFYSLGDFAIAEQTIFIYEDNTFEAMDENGSAKDGGEGPGHQYRSIDKRTSILHDDPSGA